MKNENGFTGIDIVISVITITIFVALIANLITNINLKSTGIERKTKATSYAVQEIEKLKAQGYKEDYENKGISQEDTLDEQDIYSNSEFTGYHKKTTIEDYVLIQNDTTKEANLVKRVTVEISYLLVNKEQNIQISTIIAKD